MDAETRARLEAERSETTTRVEELARAFADVVAASRDVATDDEHDPEGHTIAFERQQLDALLQAARRHLDELERAVDRLASGRYGVCERCGRPVGDERLDALPETRVCIDCA